MTELRPAQQSSDWDPTVADPLYVPELGDRFRVTRVGYDIDEGYDFQLERIDDRKPGVSRAVLAWTFAALVVILAILAAALLVAAPR